MRSSSAPLLQTCDKVCGRHCRTLTVPCLRWNGAPLLSLQSCSSLQDIVKLSCSTYMILCSDALQPSMR
ncbi:hypothetical protein PGB90_007034 [Kerria lacca]